MSEIKHTPLTGPWELVETHHEGILNSWHIQIGEDQVPVFPFRRVYSADRTQSGFVTDHDRMAAFRVAAAAPELLEAAQEALALGGKVYHNGNAHEATKDWGEVRQLLMAAIAKATGSQS